MRHPVLMTLCLGSAVVLSACNTQSDADVARALASVNVIDESNLSEVMLTSADPEEAVAYFLRASIEKPDRIDLKRGLAKSLVRAKKPSDASEVWKAVLGMPGATDEDRVDYAEALIRMNEWERAEAALNAVPPTYETFDRYRLEAMVADFRKDWKKADSFYEIAAGLTTTPASVLNNWGFSKLSRGDHAGAERLFTEALTYDTKLFTAKNNLVLARAAQGKYDLPVMSMTQVEKAQLLYTAALSAIKRGDVNIGRTLLQQAVDTHPQHFEQAARALAALDANVGQG
ncbi:tetratricopeptide repeat protein [Phaeovulum sp.]|uniref:tetratricopeptide repeat protein n=1 Tax=Phaeovulum sp. TaxID=2934796 RepID=UPI003562357A